MHPMVQHLKKSSVECGTLQCGTEVNLGVTLTSHLPCAGPSFKILCVLARFFFAMTQRGEYDHCRPLQRLGLELRQPGSRFQILSCLP